MNQELVKFEHIRFSPQEHVLVEKYNDGSLTHEFLLDQLNQKKFGVGTYCRWMEYLGLKDQVEPEYYIQYFQVRSSNKLKLI
jgi:hypothetical protein